MAGLKAKGVEFVHEEPQPCPAGIYAAFRDPFGNVMEKNLSTASLQSTMPRAERFTGVRLIQEHGRFYGLRTKSPPDFTSTGLALLI